MLKNESEAGKNKLRELINIIRKARIASKRFARPMVFQTTFNPEQAAKIKELKQLLGVSSMQRVIEVCVELVYDQKTPLK